MLLALLDLGSKHAFQIVEVFPTRPPFCCADKNLRICNSAQNFASALYFACNHVTAQPMTPSCTCSWTNGVQAVSEGSISGHGCRLESLGCLIRVHTFSGSIAACLQSVGQPMPFGRGAVPILEVGTIIEALR